MTTGAGESGSAESSRIHGSMTSETPSNDPDTSNPAQSSEEKEKLLDIPNEARSYSDPSPLADHQSHTAQMPSKNRPAAHPSPLTTNTLTPPSLPLLTASSDETAGHSPFSGAHNFRVGEVGIVHAAGNLNITQYYLALFSLGTCCPRLLPSCANSDDESNVGHFCLLESFNRRHLGRGRESGAPEELGYHAGSIIYIRAFFFFEAPF